MKSLIVASLMTLGMSTAVLAADPVYLGDIAVDTPFDWSGVYTGGGVAVDIGTGEISPSIYTGVRYQNSNSFIGAELELYGVTPIFEGAQVTGRAGVVNETGAIYALGGVDVDFATGDTTPVVGAGVSVHLDENASIDIVYTTTPSISPVAFDDHRVRVGFSVSF